MLLLAWGSYLLFMEDGPRCSDKRGWELDGGWSGGRKWRVMTSRHASMPKVVFPSVDPHDSGERGHDLAVVLLRLGSSGKGVFRLWWDGVFAHSQHPC